MVRKSTADSGRNENLSEAVRVQLESPYGIVTEKRVA